jgi:hypothetical protein
MKIAAPVEDPGQEPILLIRPVTAVQLGAALGKKPFEIVAEMMDLDHYVSTKVEIPDGCLFDYSRSLKIEFRIVDRPKD